MSVDVTQGSGKTVAASIVGGEEVQEVKLLLGADTVGVNWSVNTGNADTGTPRVVLASDQPTVTVDAPVATPVNVQISDGTDTALVSAGGALLTDASATTQPISGSLTNISGTVSLPTGAATATNQLAAGHTVAPIVGTTGGATPFYNDGVATETAVKGSGGQLYFIHAVNLTATVKWLQLFNGTTGTYVPGTTTPTNEFAIPTQGDTNGAGFVCPIPMGLAYGTAITLFISTAQGGGTAAAANEVNVNIGYA